MSFDKVAIIGLGLLGGSIGLAVAQDLPGIVTAGYDADPARHPHAEILILPMKGAFVVGGKNVDTSKYLPLYQFS